MRIEIESVREIKRRAIQEIEMRRKRNEASHRGTGKEGRQVDKAMEAIGLPSSSCYPRLLDFA